MLCDVCKKLDQKSKLYPTKSLDKIDSDLYDMLLFYDETGTFHSCKKST